MLMLSHVYTECMPVVQWSGGSTTQIAISPSGSQYAARDFIWRISSATVELDESDFTMLPDYNRIIASLDGRMTLASGGAVTVIEPLNTVYRFDGAAHTHCTGKASDINLMLRKEKADGSLEFLDGGRFTLRLDEGETAVFYYIKRNTADIFTGKGVIEHFLSDTTAFFKIRSL